MKRVEHIVTTCEDYNLTEVELIGLETFGSGKFTSTESLLRDTCKIMNIMQTLYLCRDWDIEDEDLFKLAFLMITNIKEIKYLLDLITK